MAEIYLPEKIIFERNALEHFSAVKAERIILICDNENVQNRGIFDLTKSRCSKTSSHVSAIFNTNVYELYNLACEEFFSHEADLIIAIGSGAVIDCGMLLTNESGAKFTAIPCCCASSLTDFENGRYYSYRHSPSTLILDPALIQNEASSTVAYDALAAFSFAIDTLSSTDNIITRSLAVHGAIGIFRNIIPAYRGDISSLEKLMYSMYFAVASHRNAKRIEDSLLNKVSSFFADFGYSKSSLCALILPNIMEYEEERIRDELFGIATAVGLAQPDDDPPFANIKLIDEIRRIQACVGVPRAVSGFNLTENAYQTRKIHSTVSDDLLDLCYYGSFKFMKL